MLLLEGTDHGHGHDDKDDHILCGVCVCLEIGKKRNRSPSTVMMLRRDVVIVVRRWR